MTCSRNLVKFNYIRIFIIASPPSSQVRDTKLTSYVSSLSSRRKDVTIAWNEPRAAYFIGENVPAEHLMYVLEINPPLDMLGE